MNPRYLALQALGSNRRLAVNGLTANSNISESFGKQVFNRAVMQKMLPREVYKNLVNAIDGLEKIKPEFADVIALAMKEWAMSHGATHYCHWFQPLTGSVAEKHDSFIDWNDVDQVLEKFNGKQLIQGEPDASSFPSGGLRSTYEARGYTGWDPTSPVFLWQGGDGMTLCIPSVFFSWTGDVLDTKIPLLRSDRKVSDAVMRLLELTGISARFVNSTLGCEQEYFVIDRHWRNLRPDLVLSGRTVFGTASPKGQQLQDHYFGSVKDRILYYMQDFELEAIKLGIPVKTRHNEVAPAQHEVAPVFERSSVAIDHNLLLMELMRHIAIKHDLTCLLHEKPFAGINGSGKHCNWSLATDTGINLLDPTDTPENNTHFLILLVAILDAVHKHSALLRASIASAANDHRLGGHEAPPAIISVYLGDELETILDNIEKTGAHKRTTSKGSYDLNIPITPHLTRDYTDRNRTSPFAFTGNKFEFRAVGSSLSPSFPMTVLNAIVADSLNHILDEIYENLKSNKSPSKQELAKAVLPVLQKYLKQSRHIRFGGDNYSHAWEVEAKKRGLPVVKKSIDAFEALISKSSIRVFEGVLKEQELKSRHDILLETYSHTIAIEIRVMIDLFQTQILPAALKYQSELASSLALCQAQVAASHLKHQKSVLQKLITAVEKGIETCDLLHKKNAEAEGISSLEKQGKTYCNSVLPVGEQLREIVDELEGLIDDSLWPLPKYREMLFLI